MNTTHKSSENTTQDKSLLAKVSAGKAAFRVMSKGQLIKLIESLCEHSDELSRLIGAYQLFYGCIKKDHPVAYETAIGTIKDEMEKAGAV